MTKFMFGLTTQKPSVKAAKRWDKICKEEGGYGYTEVNRRKGDCPSINNGYYQGWFSAPNRGTPFDNNLANRVKSRISTES